MNFVFYNGLRFTSKLSIKVHRVPQKMFLLYHFPDINILTKVVHLLLLMNLHWHIIMIQSL